MCTKHEEKTFKKRVMQTNFAVIYGNNVCYSYCTSAMALAKKQKVM